MSALPPEDRQPDPRERKPNRAVGGDPDRQRDLTKPWANQPGDLHRKRYGRGAITRAAAMRVAAGRQRRKGR